SYISRVGELRKTYLDVWGKLKPDLERLVRSGHGIDAAIYRAALARFGRVARELEGVIESDTLGVEPSWIRVFRRPLLLVQRAPIGDDGRVAITSDGELWDDARLLKAFQSGRSLEDILPIHVENRDFVTAQIVLEEVYGDEWE